MALCEFQGLYHLRRKSNWAESGARWPPTPEQKLCTTKQQHATTLIWWLRRTLMKDDVMGDVTVWDEWNCDETKVIMTTWWGMGGKTKHGIKTVIHMDGGLWRMTCYRSTYTLFAPEALNLRSHHNLLHILHLPRRLEQILKASYTPYVCLCYVMITENPNVQFPLRKFWNFP